MLGPLGGQKRRHFHFVQLGEALQLDRIVGRKATAPGPSLSAWTWKSLPSFAVGLVRQGDHGTLKTTDAQGRVSFPVSKAGRWLLRATDLRPSSKPEADWESDFTTLTFEVQ